MDIEGHASRDDRKDTQGSWKMSPEIICTATEPHRKVIGWWSIFFGVTLMATLAASAAWKSRQAEIAKASMEVAKAATEDIEDNITRLEDAIRDMVSVSDRPFILYHAGSVESGDERTVSWPPAAEKLLGWTMEDVNQHGLEVMMPNEDDKERHATAMELAITRRPGDRRTSIIHCDVVTKGGEVLPVRITTWVGGDHTRSVAAVIEAESKINEQRIQ